jgi:hypothetical protein
MLVCVYTTHTNTNTHIRTRARTHTRSHGWTCTVRQSYLRTCMYVCMYVNIYIYIYIYIYTHTHTNTRRVVCMQSAAITPALNMCMLKSVPKKQLARLISRGAFGTTSNVHASRRKVKVTAVGEVHHRADRGRDRESPKLPCPCPCPRTLVYMSVCVASMLMLKMVVIYDPRKLIADVCEYVQDANCHCAHAYCTIFLMTHCSSTHRLY